MKYHWHECGLLQSSDKNVASSGSRKKQTWGQERLNDTGRHKQRFNREKAGHGFWTMITWFSHIFIWTAYMCRSCFFHACIWFAAFAIELRPVSSALTWVSAGSPTLTDCVGHAVQTDQRSHDKERANPGTLGPIQQCGTMVCSTWAPRNTEGK